MQGLYTLLNVVRVGQVHLFYRARLLDTDFAPGRRPSRPSLFAEAEIPWDEIAFRTTKRTLELLLRRPPRGGRLRRAHEEDID